MSETKALLIERNNGEHLVVEGVPVDAKVTFSGVNPSKPGYGGHCVRIYTSKENQLGVFTGVLAFRDLSLKVKKRSAKTAASSVTETGPNKQRDRAETTTEYEWVEVEAAGDGDPW